MKSLAPIAGERIWAEIDINCLRENIRLIKKITKGKKILLAVKADAYGHGAKEIAPYLEGEVDCFGVASVEEGIALRENGTNRTDVLILSPVPYPEIPYLLEYNLIPTVTEENFLPLLTRVAKKRNKIVPVYLEIDTGMGRTGILPETAKKIIPEILRNPYMKLVGIFSHFPAADCDFSFTKEQITQFKDFIKKLPKGKYLLSLANSAGLINFPVSHLQMVRPGLLAYGIIPEIIAGKEKLSPILSKVKPVLALYSRVVNLRHLPKGASISYGRRFILPKASLIAVISAGYGDGIPYSLTNRGEVLIKGKRVKMVGAVCMDLFMIDVSEVEGVKIGDRVTIIGENGEERIKVTDVAFWANTIPYEITCRISPRVRRVFKEGEKILKVR
ncbi:MAG: alanine racemase [candidate division WOR-3 bacterium]